MAPPYANQVKGICQDVGSLAGELPLLPEAVAPAVANAACGVAVCQWNRQHKRLCQQRVQEGSGDQDLLPEIPQLPLLQHLLLFSCLPGDLHEQPLHDAVPLGVERSAADAAQSNTDSSCSTGISHHITARSSWMRPELQLYLHELEQSQWTASAAMPSYQQQQQHHVAGNAEFLASQTGASSWGTTAAQYANQQPVCDARGCRTLAWLLAAHPWAAVPAGTAASQWPGAVPAQQAAGQVLQAGPACSWHPNLQPVMLMTQCRSIDCSSINSVCILSKYTPTDAAALLRFSPASLGGDWHLRFLLHQLLHAVAALHERGLALGGFALEQVALACPGWLQLLAKPAGQFLQPQASRQHHQHLMLRQQSQQWQREWQQLLQGQASQGPMVIQEPYYTLPQLTELWRCRKISNFEYLMWLNAAAGRRWGDRKRHPFLPWVIDFTVRPQVDCQGKVVVAAGGSSNPGPGWRDLGLSQYRRIKGDAQLDQTYAMSSMAAAAAGAGPNGPWSGCVAGTPESVAAALAMDPWVWAPWDGGSSSSGSGMFVSGDDSGAGGFGTAAAGAAAAAGMGVVHPHHISNEPMSELSYAIYTARRLPVELLVKLVRRSFRPEEYPGSLEGLYNSSPDEALPQFYCDPRVFVSTHPSMRDLAVPAWARDPADFVQVHRAALESEYVSANLHKWINLTFGVALSGPAGKAAKNIHLGSTASSSSQHGRTDTGVAAAAAGDEGVSVVQPITHGVCQLFQQPHPTRSSCKAEREVSSTSSCSARMSPLVPDGSRQASAAQQRRHVGPDSTNVQGQGCTSIDEQQVQDTTGDSKFHRVSGTSAAAALAAAESGSMSERQAGKDSSTELDTCWIELASLEAAAAAGAWQPSAVTSSTTRQHHQQHQQSQPTAAHSSKLFSSRSSSSKTHLLLPAEAAAADLAAIGQVALELYAKQQQAIVLGQSAGFLAAQSCWAYCDSCSTAGSRCQHTSDSNSSSSSNSLTGSRQSGCLLQSGAQATPVPPAVSLFVQQCGSGSFSAAELLKVADFLPPWMDDARQFMLQLLFKPQQQRQEGQQMQQMQSQVQQKADLTHQQQEQLHCCSGPQASRYQQDTGQFEEAAAADSRSWDTSIESSSASRHGSSLQSVTGSLAAPGSTTDGTIPDSGPPVHNHNSSSTAQVARWEMGDAFANLAHLSVPGGPLQQLAQVPQALQICLPAILHIVRCKLLHGLTVGQGGPDTLLIGLRPHSSTNQQQQQHAGQQQLQIQQQQQQQQQDRQRQHQQVCREQQQQALELLDSACVIILRLASILSRLQLQQHLVPLVVALLTMEAEELQDDATNSSAQAHMASTRATRAPAAAAGSDSILTQPHQLDPQLQPAAVHFAAGRRAALQPVLWQLLAQNLPQQQLLAALLPPLLTAVLEPQGDWLSADSDGTQGGSCIPPLQPAAAQGSKPSAVQQQQQCCHNQQGQPPAGQFRRQYASQAELACSCLSVLAECLPFPVLAQHVLRPLMVAVPAGSPPIGAATPAAPGPAGTPGNDLLAAAATTAAATPWFQAACGLLSVARVLPKQLAEEFIFRPTLQLSLLPVQSKLEAFDANTAAGAAAAGSTAAADRAVPGPRAGSVSAHLTVAALPVLEGLLLQVLPVLDPGLMLPNMGTLVSVHTAEPPAAPATTPAAAGMGDGASSSSMPSSYAAVGSGPGRESGLAGYGASPGVASGSAAAGKDGPAPPRLFHLSELLLIGPDPQAVTACPLLYPRIAALLLVGMECLLLGGSSSSSNFGTSAGSSSAAGVASLYSSWVLPQLLQPLLSPVVAAAWQQGQRQSVVQAYWQTVLLLYAAAGHQLGLPILRASLPDWHSTEVWLLAETGWDPDQASAVLQTSSPASPILLLLQALAQHGTCSSTALTAVAAMYTTNGATSSTQQQQQQDLQALGLGLLCAADPAAASLAAAAAVGSSGGAHHHVGIDGILLSGGSTSSSTVNGPQTGNLAGRVTHLLQRLAEEKVVRRSLNTTHGFMEGVGWSMPRASTPSPTALEPPAGSAPVSGMAEQQPPVQGEQQQGLQGRQGQGNLRAQQLHYDAAGGSGAGASPATAAAGARPTPRSDSDDGVAGTSSHRLELQALPANSHMNRATSAPVHPASANAKSMGAAATTATKAATPQQRHEVAKQQQKANQHGSSPSATAAVEGNSTADQGIAAKGRRPATGKAAGQNGHPGASSTAYESATAATTASLQHAASEAAAGPMSPSSTPGGRTAPAAAAAAAAASAPSAASVNVDVARHADDASRVLEVAQADPGSRSAPASAADARYAGVTGASDWAAELSHLRSLLESPSRPVTAERGPSAGKEWFWLRSNPKLDASHLLPSFTPAQHAGGSSSSSQYMFGSWHAGSGIKPWRAGRAMWWEEGWNLGAVCLHSWPAHKEKLRALAADPWERLVVTAGRGGAREVGSAHGSSVVRVWELADAEAKVQYVGHPAAVHQVAFLAAGSRVVASLDVTGAIHVWCRTTGVRLQAFQPEELSEPAVGLVARASSFKSSVAPASTSPDGRTAASAGAASASSALAPAAVAAAAGQPAMGLSQAKAAASSIEATMAQTAAAAAGADGSKTGSSSISATVQSEAGSGTEAVFAAEAAAAGMTLPAFSTSFVARGCSSGRGWQALSSLPTARQLAVGAATAANAAGANSPAGPNRLAGLDSSAALMGPGWPVGGGHFGYTCMLPISSNQPFADAYHLSSNGSDSSDYGGSSGSSSSPGLLLAGTADGHVCCLDVETGGLVEDMVAYWDPKPLLLSPGAGRSSTLQQGQYLPALQQGQPPSLLLSGASGPGMLGMPGWEGFPPAADPSNCVVSAVCCSSRMGVGGWVGAGNGGGRVMLLDLRGGVVAATWQAHAQRVSQLQGLAAAHGDHYLLSCSADKTLKLWDLRMLRVGPHQSLFGSSSKSSGGGDAAAPVTTFKGGRDGIDGFVVYQDAAIVYGGANLGLAPLDLHANRDLAAAAAAAGLAGQPPVLQQQQGVHVVRMTGIRGAGLRSSGVREGLGSTGVGIVGLGLLPHSKLLVVGTEDGALRICR